ncbi:DUF3083 family protein [Pseudoalteromonas sp. NEC-BIFX-2020_015]|uniref:DUF3083 family protein n=1 Tax=Pseudoalteromonas sp. NEC-BIFX-2020_015 TaxID=2729544 RepID=UPI0014616DBD|nr:DUF3083 family protein [Pseudoalteromonas sp. NEC-BIFX-2020_015]NMR25867.1 DUF3083 family protein [Pseudoalteromonas sp. NEC-BIFX-2020_015]
MASLSQNRVYIPTTARANQYILAEFKPSDNFYARFTYTEQCYERLTRQLFALCDEYELHNVHLIANDKLPVVRFHEEAYYLQTKKQILFFYNPRYHEAHKCFNNSEIPSKKIRFLFLATGDELRSNAAIFHTKVKKVLNTLQNTLLEGEAQIKVRDHQHLTYDLFAKAKGSKESYGYKLRGLHQRYQSRHCSLPSKHNEMTYATFAIPITRTIKTQFQHLLNKPTLNEFYQQFYDAFIKECTAKNLNLASMIANGTTPIVRNSKIDTNDGNSELQKLSFATGDDIEQYSHYWQSDKLVETMHFVIVASENDEQGIGHGRFMNHVESVIRAMIEPLAINKERQDITVRFFQHISYFE